MERKNSCTHGVYSLLWETDISQITIYRNVKEIGCKCKHCKKKIFFFFASSISYIRNYPQQDSEITSLEYKLHKEWCILCLATELFVHLMPKTGLPQTRHPVDSCGMVWTEIYGTVKSQVQKEKQLKQHRQMLKPRTGRSSMHLELKGREREEEQWEHGEAEKVIFFAERGHTSKDYSGILILEAVWRQAWRRTEMWKDQSGGCCSDDSCLDYGVNRNRH